MHVHTITLTDDELRVLQSSIHSWVNTFTHDQPDLLRQGKLLRERIDAELDHRPQQPVGTTTAATGAGRLGPH